MSVAVEAKVAFDDGRASMIRADLKIRSGEIFPCVAERVRQAVD